MIYYQQHNIISFTSVTADILPKTLNVKPRGKTELKIEELIKILQADSY